MKLVKRTLRFLAWFLGILLALIIAFIIYVLSIGDTEPPALNSSDSTGIEVVRIDSTAAKAGNNWIRKNRYGLYEMYVEGSPFQRGLINGKLSQQLIVDQEAAFVHQIKQMIPDPGYLKFLRYITRFMNRGLPEHVTDEYQQEIYGISLSASDSFQWIGSNYERQLNYHAAHDIGHALQNLMLVGCTSFGAWDTKTEKGELLLARNFDFWVGDEFAKNKIVEFVRPSSGHQFAFITWGGFIGVVSGMNDQGLTVTINAAKSRIPTNAATPVSLVAREILQYAGNINEAIAIAKKRTMFVSESFLIGSAADHRSVIIEKTPDDLAVYDAASDHIICTNHYQSKLLKGRERNLEQMENSASVYRYQRVQELLQQNYPLTPQRMADILRDHRGQNDIDIGVGNEKAVNQMIAHHAVIFMPDSLRMWVSTAPWQLGTFVCYDLRKIFYMKGLPSDEPVADTALNIPPDTFLQSQAFLNFMQFRELKMQWTNSHHHARINPDLLVRLNPNYYDAYKIAGDYCMQQNEYERAAKFYTTALQKEIATQEERAAIEKQLQLAQKRHHNK